MDPATVAGFDTFSTYWKHQRLLTDYIYVGAIALMIWDYVLTLPREIRLIWFSPWSYMKILFLSTKWITMFTASAGLYLQITPNPEFAKCKFLYEATVWLLIIKIAIAEAILGVRTWAVWQRNTKVGISLLVTMTANVIVQFAFLISFNKTSAWSQLPTPFPNFKGCLITGSTRIPVIQTSTSVVYDIFVLGLMITSARISYRMCNNMQELSSIVYRDGIMFYTLFTLMQIVNFVCLLVLPLDLFKMLPPLEDVLYCILVRRTVLDIRDACAKPSNPTTTSMRELDEEEFPADLAFELSNSPEHTTWTKDSYQAMSSHAEDPALVTP